MGSHYHHSVIGFADLTEVLSPDPPVKLPLLAPSLLGGNLRAGGALFRCPESFRISVNPTPILGCEHLSITSRRRWLIRVADQGASVKK
jgi:hypothetical protein